MISLSQFYSNVFVFLFSRELNELSVVVVLVLLSLPRLEPYSIKRIAEREDSVCVTWICIEYIWQPLSDV